MNSSGKVSSLGIISTLNIAFLIIFISYAEYEDFGDDIMMSPDSVVNDMKVLDIRVSEDTSSCYTHSYQAKY